MIGLARRSPSALVLAAHGAHWDPAANARIEQRVRELAELRIADQTVAAYHQGEPQFSTVLDGLAAERVVVVPFMTSEGHYTASILPAALKLNRRFGEVELTLTLPVGRHAGIAPVVARRVGELCRAEGLPRGETVLVVVGHGTARHDQSRNATLDLVEDLSRRRILADVLPAFLDDEPGLDGLLELAGDRHLVVVPFLIGGGSHAQNDLPRRLGLSSPEAEAGPMLEGHRGRRVILDVPVGQYAELTGFVADLARRHLAPAKRYSHRLPRPIGKVGAVALVGAGPGDPELITVRGLTRLREADVVLHDRLVASELLAEVRPEAEIIDVGKLPGGKSGAQERINALLVERAGQGLRVVRLKGGDPFVFGRGSEERAACLAAGIACEVIPGLTSAFAAPAAAGIPITARGIARSAAIVTARSESGDGFEPGQAAALAGLDTVVILMGRAALAEVARSLLQAGRDPETPAACIEAATTPRQRVVRGTLATIAAVADREGIASPVVTVVGEVARLAEVPVLSC